MRWQPAPGTSWQWQLSSRPETLLDVDAYDLDGFDTSEATVDRIHANGGRAICYISVGSWENWRPDKGRFPPSGRPGSASGAWEGMTRGDQIVVETIMANCGKALEAYERLLVSRNAPLDRYVEGDFTALSTNAKRGLKLFISRDALPEPEEDEFYLADLVGLSVETPEGESLGKVKSVHDFGAGDLLEIAPPGAATWWLPFTRENVPEVRLAEGRLIAVRPDETE